MPQRYNIVTIDFEANARKANAAIDAMAEKCKECNDNVKDLKKQLDEGKKANLPIDQIEALNAKVKSAEKETRQWTNAYKQLVKGMHTLAIGIKAFNDGELDKMSAAFQKTLYNATKLVRTKLDPLSDSYKKDKKELKALMDASQQYYARLQADTQQVISTISKGGKVSRQAIEEELKQQKELLSVLSEADQGYDRTAKRVAILDHYLKAMGGSYEYIRKNISDTKKVSDETLRNMFNELQQTNNEGKVTQRIMRDNSKAMREIRNEQSRRVESVLGGDLGKRSEAEIRGAIASAKELIQVYGSSSKRAKELSAQVINAEEYLKTVGVEGARAAKKQADASQLANERLKQMRDNMANLRSLSHGALIETQKFWQEQLEGSKRGTDAYRRAERNLKAIAAEQERINSEQLQRDAKGLNRKNLGTLSMQELQNAIAASKQLAASMKPTTQEYKDLVANIIRGEEYLKQFGLEGQRSAKQVADQLNLMNSRMYRLSTLSDGALEETRKFWQAQMDGADRGSKKFNDAEVKLEKIVERQKQLTIAQNKVSADKLLQSTSTKDGLKNMGEGEIRKAIDAAREYQKTLSNDTKEYQDLSVAIARASEYVKLYGVETARAKLKEDQLLTSMTDRLNKLRTLSASALAETQKFWQAQVQGADHGSSAYGEAEAKLKRVNDEINKRSYASALRIANKPGNYSDAEIRQSIEMMEKLRDAQVHSSTEWNRYNKVIQDSKKYLEEWSKVDAVTKHEDEMKNLAQLSETALAENKKFWETMVAGAQQGSKELKDYEARLEEVKREENNRNEYTSIDLGGDLDKMSESEIRRAIEAGKQLIQTYATGSDEAKNLAKQIVDAETHLEKYGVSAERAAQREADALKKAAEQRAKNNQDMRDQLDTMMSQTLSGQSLDISESALKAQRQYWQRLIDDPKTASTSLQEYKNNLIDVNTVLDSVVEEKGKSALSFFRNGTGDASADEVRQQADALKQWRDSLPAQTQASVIAEIDGYLAKLGKTAQDTSGQLMSLRDAYKIGLQGLKGWYDGTPEQLKQAKKTLEETIAVTDKGSDRFNKLQRALDGIALEEKRVGEMSKEMKAVLDQPKGRSFNELKMAVEQGRKALNAMDRTTKDGQAAFDELAKKVKEADFEMKNLGNSSKGTASAFEKAWTRLKTYVTFYVGAAAALQKLGTTVDDLMVLSDKMGEVRKTTGFTADQVGRLSDNLANLDTRTPLTELMDLSAAAGQLGLNTQADVQGFTEAANEMLVALPEMGTEGATEMMKIALATGEVKKIQKQMEEGTVEGSSATAVAMEKIGSTIDRLRATTAAAAPPIADFVKRVGAVGAQSGISVDQVAALGATVDSLGMGTEMAATAISRMIPAIKNNAFDIAHAIGVTPDTLRELFDTGKGMEAVLMVLEKMRDDGMDANTIESFLGENGMQGLMKELDQQGARAGIVFAGLSNNVDTLRANLETANQAYSDGTAITSEYIKMNDTVAAKWARLKNQLEEFFVSDNSQRWLGGVIDLLRKLVNILTGNDGVSAAIRSLGILVAAMRLQLASMVVGSFSAIIKGLKGIAAGLGLVKTTMGTLGRLNVFLAIASAIAYFVFQMKNAKSATDVATEAFGRAQFQILKATNQFNSYWRNIQLTNAAVRRAAASHNALSAEVDKMRKSTNKGSAATANLSKKEQELKNSENAVTRASQNHRAAIQRFNSIYGKYLNFILTEINYSHLNAAAHDQVTASIKREILMKQRQAAIDEIDSKSTQDIASGFSGIYARLVQDGGMSQQQATKTMQNLQNYFKANYQYDKSSGKVAISKTEQERLRKSGIDPSKIDPNVAMGIYAYDYLRNHFSKMPVNVVADITGVYRSSYHGRSTWGRRTTYTESNIRSDWAAPLVEREENVGPIETMFDSGINEQDQNISNSSKAIVTKSIGLARQLVNKIKNKKTSPKDREKAYKELANEMSAISGNVGNLNKQKEGGTIKQANDFIASINKDKGINSSKLRQYSTDVDQTVGQSYNNNAATNINETVPAPVKSSYFSEGNTGPNPWGDNQSAASTDWSKMSGDTLVDRRKQMNKFVRALQEDSDVSAVLSEDPALQNAISKGKVKNNADSVIDWYNTQRLKIQEELHKRYLTNTGNWLDPTKKKTKKGRQRSPRKIVNDEISYYLDSLDAYYTNRKSGIEEAQNNGEITEAEGWRQTLQNEEQWRNRRAELQMLYTKKSTKVTQDEQDAIYDIISDRTGETTSMIKANIQSTVGFIQKVGEKSVPEMRAIYGNLDKGIEKDFFKVQKAISTQMSAIQAIIDKERPFNGITRNLEENMTKMGLLQADFEKQRIAFEKKGLTKDDDEMVDLKKRYENELPKRLNFLLEESEHAYELTWEQLAEDMKDKGFGSWLDAIVNSDDADEKKRGILAQIHTVFDDVQDAIKKESSLVKKQVEIAWNDTSLLHTGMSIKQTYDKAISALGIDESSTSRANSIINAGPHSERVADKLAIKQMQIQLDMQTHYYNMMRKIGQQRIDDLIKAANEQRKLGKETEAERLELDAKHAAMSLDLSIAEEENDLAKQRADLIAKADESQNRLYTHLREWGSLLSSSVQSIYEAENTGLGDYYNDLAKMRLTGEGSAGGTYIITENAGTKDAKAHYETLDGEQALKRQLQIEQRNATADAWKKVMDDINKKINDEITDWMNSALQINAINDNTKALVANTAALYAAMGGAPGLSGNDVSEGKFSRNAEGMAVDADNNVIYPIKPTGPEQSNDSVPSWSKMSWDTKGSLDLWSAYKDWGIEPTAEFIPRKTSGIATDFDSNELYPVQPAESSDAEAPQSFWPTTGDHAKQMIDNISAVWSAYRDYGIAAQTEMAEANAELTSSGATVPTLPATDEQKEKMMSNTQEVLDNYKEGTIQASEEIADANTDKQGSFFNPNSLDDVAVVGYRKVAEVSTEVTKTVLDNQNQMSKGASQTDKKMTLSGQSMYAKLTQAANLYGIAYSAMSNDNLSTSQKFSMITLQAAGQAAMAMMTADMFKSETGALVSLPQILSECLKIDPIAGAAIFAVLSALIGGAIGAAMSQLTKGKSQVAQVTGASAGAGRLSTGMLTYAEGNVNEFTDPSTLTPGKSYNVDGADGRTYRAKYTGKNAKTHITNGPEFHLVGERGKEAIIDAHTTRLLQMDDTGIWQSIQTLYNGGGLRSVRRRHGGMRTFADGNINDFADVALSTEDAAGETPDASNDMALSLQASLDRNNDLLERALDEGIKGVFNVYGKDGLIDSYDRGKKTVTRHGEKY